MENEKNPTEIANAALPSTVLLEIESANDQPYRTGSGFFVGEGEIVTNFHVVEDARKGSAKLFGQDEWYDIEKYTALDIDNDLIVLKIEAPDQAIVDTPALPIGDSNDIHTGDTIYAVGNPAGWESTISDGIISGIRQEPWLDKRIQITAPISPGSSGGPVLNTKGEVIGVVSGGHSLRSIPLSQNSQEAQYINVAQNLNFAIPSNYLRSLLKQRNEREAPNFLSLAKLERVRHIDRLGW
ncbi:serine protease, partial [Candidatus Poribacteria bacterium]|nr:serine protease [Candidatus Poribacteria bacterium]